MKKIGGVATARHDDQKMRKGVLEIMGSKEREKKEEAQVEEFSGPIYIKLLKYSLHRLERIEGSMWVFGTLADRKFSPEWQSGSSESDV